jgi:hypothetical protein
VIADDGLDTAALATALAELGVGLLEPYRAG